MHVSCYVPVVVFMGQTYSAKRKAATMARMTTTNHITTLALLFLFASRASSSLLARSSSSILVLCLAMTANIDSDRIARVEGAYEHLATEADVANLRAWLILIVLGSDFAFEIVIPRLLG